MIKIEDCGIGFNQYLDLPYATSRVAASGLFQQIWAEAHVRTSMSYSDDLGEYISLRDQMLSVVASLGYMYSSSCCEALQFSRYTHSQQYRHHLDYHHRDVNPRVATIMLYLNDVIKGGETEFARLRISVKPSADTILFWQYPRGQRSNQRTLHCARPVIEGTKYVVTLWIRHSAIETV